MLATNLYLMLAGVLIQQSYVFVEDTDRLVVIGRSDGIMVGKLDADGEFTAHFRHSGFYSGFRKLTWLNKGTVEPQEVYEFRSGMLIPGKQSAWGNFIPAAGGKIIRFADYKYSPTAARIWNLPGYFRAVILDVPRAVGP